MNKKITVALRRKNVSKGRQSLYLDFYPPIMNPQTNQPTRREFLKLYVFIKPRNPIEKKENDDNLRTANLIKIKRQNELSKDNIYSEFEKEQLQLRKIEEECFIEFFKKEADKRQGKNYDIWTIAIEHFTDFLKNDNLKFSEITVPLIEDYKEYLLKAKSKRKSIEKISTNTALSYFNKIKAALKKAYRDGKLKTDVNAGVSRIKEQETKRNFLTIDEAKKLAQTDCTNNLVKKASLFSILTGLRYSDIEKLQWKNIEYFENDGYYIRFQQKKTENHETMPIPESAFILLGERKDHNDKVFED
jgi:integrase